jgi:hypothetical protein
MPDDSQLNKQPPLIPAAFCYQFDQLSKLVSKGVDTVRTVRYTICSWLVHREPPELKRSVAMLELFVTDKHSKRTQRIQLSNADELTPETAKRARKVAFGVMASVYVQDANGATRYSVTSADNVRRCDY